MKKAEIVFGVLRIPLDALAITTALLLSHRLRLEQIDLILGLQLLEPAHTLPFLSDYISTFVIPGVMLFLVIAVFLRLYSFRVTVSSWVEVGRIILAAFVWLVCVMGWYFLIRKQLFYSRILLVHSTFFTVFFVALGRASLILVQRAFLHLGVGVRHVVSIGSKAPSKGALQIFEEDVRYCYHGHFKRFVSLKTTLETNVMDLVLQTDPHPRSRTTIKLINFCRNNHIGYGFLPPVFADVPHQLVVEKLGLLPLLRFQPTPLDGWGRVFKRLFDIVVSAVLLLFLSPILLFIALLVELFDGSPIVYVSRRVGDQGKKTIPVFKFRTMVKDADKKKQFLLRRSHRRDGPLFKMKDDPRITSLGSILRRWSLDELPQLLNVFVGHMSLVGPRPHLPQEVKRYAPEERRVFAVRPGITGLSQISGRSDLKFAQEVTLDLRYIEEWSLFLDLWILWRTMWVVFSRRGAD